MIKMINKTTLMAAVVAVSSAGVAQAGTINPDIIFGSGNTNRGFEVSTVGSLELGLRAKLRWGPSGPNDELGIGIIRDTDGNYLFDSSVSTASPTQSMWNYEWAINSNVDGNGGGLDTYTYQISVDTDPTVNENFSIMYDPLSSSSTGYYLGTNATGNGGASFTSVPDILGGSPGDFTNNNVAQNSVQLQWVGGSTGSGQFAVRLSAFSNGTEVASTTIQSIVDAPAPIPLPAALPLLLFGLGGLGLMRRRKNKTA